MQIAILLFDKLTVLDAIGPYEVLRSVPGNNAFASVITVTRRVAIPSLLLTYQLYGDVDQEADVIARNNVRHPGFIAGDLKVLSNA